MSLHPFIQRFCHPKGPLRPFYSVNNRLADRVAVKGRFTKSLKEFIAAQPDVALKEEGLETIQVEYPFLTGDRIDVLLQDKNGQACNGGG